MKPAYLPLALSGASLALAPDLAHGFTYPQVPVKAAHTLECYMIAANGRAYDLTALCAQPVYVAAVAEPEYWPVPAHPSVHQAVTVNVEIHTTPAAQPKVKVSTHRTPHTNPKQPRPKVANRPTPRQGKG